MGIQIQAISDIDHPVPLISEQASESRASEHLSRQVLELARRLQTTLELDELITLLSDELNRVVRFDGISYENSLRNITLSRGEPATYHYSYQLLISEIQLGVITFFRHHPLSERDLQKTENLLCALIYPLRNALLYRNAVQMASVDPLTGLNNRTGMDATIRREIDLANRHGSPTSLLLLDIDHFKAVNDKHGHADGDLALQAVARCIRETMRSSDIAFRYGGEEFLLLLSHTEIEGAMLLAERLRQNIENLKFPSNETLRITASLGATGLRQKDEPASLFERADAALYSAKKNGRNRVVQG